MNIYTITKVSKMGEAHPEYGQTWWGEVKESDFPVMFNSKTAYIAEGQVLTCEEQERKQGKKSEYLRLKKVKLAQSDKPAETPTASKADHSYSILMELKKQTKLLEKLVGEGDATEGDWVPSDSDIPEGV